MEKTTDLADKRPLRHDLTATTLDELPTPALLLDRDRLERNLERMARRTDELGVALRPHMKTHKSPEIARRQRDLGACGITVSTLYEARVFAEHGFDDVTWAFPVILSRLDEATALAERIRLGILVDSHAAVQALEEKAYPFRVWLKVDSGYHRAGVDPHSETAWRLAAALAGSPCLAFAGLLTHSGHAYDVRGSRELKAVAEEERSLMVELAARLGQRGIPVPQVSVGSTPAMSAVRDLDGVTEARPGNYAFYDHSQTRIGSCDVRDCAVTVLASVVSSSTSHSVLDAGALALSKDPGVSTPPRESFGEVFEDYEAARLHPDLRLTSLSQEHGRLNAPLAVGERLRILPNHSCLTVAHFDEYHVVRGREVVDRWKIWRGR